MVLLVLRVGDQAPKGEVLAAICRRAPDPGIRDPVADAAGPGLDLHVDVVDSLGEEDLVRAALRAGLRPLHVPSVGPRVGHRKLLEATGRMRLRPAEPGRLLRRGGRVVRQWPAKPRTPVRFRSPPRICGGSIAALGRLAQGESASLTRKRSEVQILYRPPEKSQVKDLFRHITQAHLTCGGALAQSQRPR